MITKVTADTPVSDEVKNHPNIRLCAGHCNRWTRHPAATIEQFPGTIVRSGGGKCQKCLNDERRASPERVAKDDANHRHTVTALDNWMNRRRDRLGMP